MYLKCVKADRPASAIKEIRAFEVPAAHHNKETYEALKKFLEDFRDSYGGKVYVNSNWALAVITHTPWNRHCNLENVKDYVVIVEHVNGQHYILNMSASEFAYEFEVVKDEEKKS